MKREIKKQLWLSKEENDRLKESARKTCLTEAGYIRMLLRSRVPKEKPDAEFYEVMNQVRYFSEQLQTFSDELDRGCRDIETDLKDAIKQWKQFQLTIEEYFLIPEKMQLL
ncbi:MAG: plasmid mobilization relaxosome protein MobC [Clostridia bacterium]